MISKKAFEVQFNWIFVLVAGAAILIFFTAIVVKQKSVSEISTKTIVLKSVEAIITGAGISTDTISAIDMPNSQIEIGCNRIALDEVSKQYQTLILFAPSLIEGKRIITQTLAFSAPYRVTNLLYMTSPQVRYIIIGDNDLALEVNRSLPVDITKEIYESTPNVINTNNYKVRFINFDLSTQVNVPSSLEEMPDWDVTMIEVDGNEQSGKIKFYEKNGNSWSLKDELPYIGKSSLIGAVYADTIDAYKCSMQNTFSKLGLVTSIILERTRGLIVPTTPTETPTEKEIKCNSIYRNSLTHLDNILSASSDFTEANVNTISDSINSLAEENKDAELNSCVLIY